EDLWLQAHETVVRTGGLVITRQRPGTASGVIFVTLEDETGTSNLVIWHHVAERYRQALLNSKLMVVSGEIQKKDGVLHVIVKRIWDYSGYLGQLNTHSRDFH
ncbi:MAG: OB-fold nucleic acid binding domain-containing protein, partial [Pseudomonadota bacterium]